MKTCNKSQTKIYNQNDQKKKNHGTHIHRSNQTRLYKSQHQCTIPDRFFEKVKRSGNKSSPFAENSRFHDLMAEAEAHGRPSHPSAKWSWNPTPGFRWYLPFHRLRKKPISLLTLFKCSVPNHSPLDVANFHGYISTNVTSNYITSSRPDEVSVSIYNSIPITPSQTFRLLSLQHHQCQDETAIFSPLMETSNEHLYPKSCIVPEHPFLLFPYQFTFLCQQNRWKSDSQEAGGIHSTSASSSHSDVLTDLYADNIALTRSDKVISHVSASLQDHLISEVIHEIEIQDEQREVFVSKRMRTPNP